MKINEVTPDYKAMVNSDNWEDKVMTVQHGYGLDKLIKDKEYYVRYEVARHGYGLDKLIDDPSWIVRKEVANQGYGLLKFMLDPNRNVRRVAKQKMKEM